MDFENFFLTEPELFTTPPPSTTTDIPFIPLPSTAVFPISSDTSSLLFPPLFIMPQATNPISSPINPISSPTKKRNRRSFLTIEDSGFSISVTGDGGYEMNKVLTVRHGYFGEETVAVNVSVTPNKAPSNVQRDLIFSYGLYAAIEKVKDGWYLGVDAGGCVGGWVSGAFTWMKKVVAGTPKEVEEKEEVKEKEG